MNLHEVVRAGRSGFLYTLLTIAFTMMLGIALEVHPETRVSVQGRFALT
jgi:hypothetical protein